MVELHVSALVGHRVACVDGEAKQMPRNRTILDIAGGRNHHRRDEVLGVKDIDLVGFQVALVIQVKQHQVIQQFPISAEGLQGRREGTLHVLHEAAQHVPVLLNSDNVSLVEDSNLGEDSCPETNFQDSVAFCGMPP